MGRSSKSENGTPQFDEDLAAQAAASMLDSLEPLMGVPVAVRKRFLDNGFSETAAEQAALAHWISMMGFGNNAGPNN